MKKLTNEQVILKLKCLYGDSLDYSKVNYINSRTPITLICPIHGEFEQYANNALQGRGGCPKCKIPLPDKETFIKKSKEIHGDKYNYSKVDFINGSTKVEIICPIHGSFYQVARSHAIEGCGCPKCGIESRSIKKTSNIDKFIQKAKEVHGNKYDYSKVDYIDNRTKVCIICPEHGEFWLRPNNHLSGQGCPDCGKTKAHNATRMSVKDFIERANIIHNNKYDYSEIKYRNTDKKVKIICPIHGEFWQTPHSHLSGSGCPDCGKDKVREKALLSLNEYIEKARNIHNNLYSYDKVNYTGMNSKICIICPEHGEFWQRAGDHIKGSGCPKCSLSKGELYISNYLDSIDIKYEPLKEIKVNYIVKNSNYFIVDFYIEIDSNKYIIEYNGQQHYKYIPYLHHGNKLEFEKQLKRDQLLREYCKNNNINLLEIKYDIPFSKIDTIINNFIYGKTKK